MSPALKPLLLPQLVKERRRAEELADPFSSSSSSSTSDLSINTPLSPNLSSTASFSSRARASSTTVAPTCSHHARLSSSCSSIDLVSCSSSTSSSYSTSCNTSVSDGPSSPVQQQPPQKTPLPDVQEEEPELSTSSSAATASSPATGANGAYDCSCDDPCAYRRLNGPLQQQAPDTTVTDDFDSVGVNYNIDYDDVGFLSDGDIHLHQAPTKKRNLMLGGQGQGVTRADIDSEPPSPLAGLATRLGSRFPTLSRWKSACAKSAASLTSSPTCELTFEHAFPVPRSVPQSRAASSRSSSLSSPLSPAPYALFSQPPAALSSNPSIPNQDGTNADADEPSPHWDSSESLSSGPRPVADAVEAGNPCHHNHHNNHIHHHRRRSSLERDRALATTPLLPPLLTEAGATATASPPSPSPLQSPTVAATPFGLQGPDPSLNSTAAPHPPHPHHHHPHHQHPLRGKPSVSSFRPGDEWSDRLGHANFTITPQPYTPDRADADSLRQLRADWDAARVNYTKHIVRTGEHYGRTSKIYALTEAKWAETRSAWRAAYGNTLDRVLASQQPADFQSTPHGMRTSRARAGSSPPLPLEWTRLLDEDNDDGLLPSRVLDTEGKFPALGDEDIVGPMVRAADSGAGSRRRWRARSEERGFWRSLVGRCGLRR